MFSIGDLVVYGQVGVCAVTDITVPSFCEPGAERQYYVLEPQNQSGVIFVPVDAQVPIRAVLSREEVERLIDRIPALEPPDFDSAGTQELKQLYSEALRSHDCERLLGLILSIYTKKQTRLRNNQKIGVIDEDVIRRAEELLYGEFATVLDIPAASMPKYIASRIKAR